MPRRRRLWIALGALAGLAGLWMAMSASPRHRTYRPPEDPIAIPTDLAAIARGKHLVEAVAVCTVCHGDDLGGKLAFDDTFLGHGYTPNLTAGPGGVGQFYGLADWVRSIRYGVRPDRHGIIFMPADYYNAISDADLGAIIAYLNSVPPVDNRRTTVELNPFARVLIDLGAFGEVVRAARIDMQAPRAPPSPDPGAYLVTLGGCTFCHGPTLAGGQGPEPGAPAASDLTRCGPLRRWSLADFVGVMRGGITPDGHAIEPRYMPWPGYRKMSDHELRSIWQTLQSAACGDRDWRGRLAEPLARRGERGEGVI